jgi:uncharacterized protein YbaP (TraB family)
MMWRFEGEGGSGHIFGTVHLGPPLINRGPPQALLAIGRNAQFATEVLMDAAAQQRFLARAKVEYTHDAPISEQSLGAELFERYLTMARRRGIADDLARQLTPWAAFLSIGRPPIPPGRSLDETLQQAASRMQRELVGLQSIDELVDDLDALPLADQITILKDTICQQDVMRQYYRELAKVYASGVPEAVSAFSDAGREDDPVYQRLKRIMLEKRNALFVQRILRLLPRGSVFLAIGAQHLSGPQGVLRRLEEAGFSVRPAP